ncbi:uncharacterized protein BDZ99DRAFT_92088 [Mytilinidion resinicola]|uniref:Uncharacterized protein n=1 Tax=Mytilinidion resinicola TaxID=574789 RepID=A0A6A6YBM1_9PEZI|nr:uncharacterized protein BDZ99DRAFT_92088 [Mytilinidion resinicola]KAF2806211.1 hypothetical protein BDZ99DRAFT_92088 [Mytilinidion resinicola]
MSVNRPPTLNRAYPRSGSLLVQRSSRLHGVKNYVAIAQQGNNDASKELYAADTNKDGTYKRLEIYDGGDQAVTSAAYGHITLYPNPAGDGLFDVHVKSLDGLDGSIVGTCLVPADADDYDCGDALGGYNGVQKFTCTISGVAATGSN